MDVAKSPPGACGGEPVGLGGAFPWAAQVVGEVTGEPQLGVGGDDDLGRAVTGLGGPGPGPGPAQGLCEESEGVLEVEETNEHSVHALLEESLRFELQSLELYKKLVALAGALQISC